jgi:hypothetical protein
MVLKLVLSQAQKPDSLQTLMHHLIFFTSQMDMDIPLNIILNMSGSIQKNYKSNWFINKVDTGPRSKAITT